LFFFAQQPGRFQINPVGFLMDNESSGDTTGFAIYLNSGERIPRPLCGGVIEQNTLRR
jgi:hypothetical protein